jgi:lysophospholipase L1-like esterase
MIHSFILFQSNCVITRVVVIDPFSFSSHFITAKMQESLRFLAIGDSLTAGFCSYGLVHHPYATHLSTLFSSVKIPIIVNEQGVSGERVVPTMVRRLETLLSKPDHPPYDWVIILGGTNDLGCAKSAEQIFNEGLKLMYEMVLRHTNGKSKLAVMTVIENGYYSPKEARDKRRQNLNEMIRNYVQNEKDQNRICLVDLDKGIQYHSIKDKDQRQRIWDDMIHLKPDGYDQMAKIIFQTIYTKIHE